MKRKQLSRPSLFDLEKASIFASIKRTDQNSASTFCPSCATDRQGCDRCGCLIYQTLFRITVSPGEMVKATSLPSPSWNFGGWARRFNQMTQLICSSKKLCINSNYPRIPFSRLADARSRSDPQSQTPHLLEISARGPRADRPSAKTVGSACIPHHFAFHLNRYIR